MKASNTGNVRENCYENTEHNFLFAINKLEFYFGSIIAFAMW